MANNRNKKKLNSTQATLISLMISILYLIFMLIGAKFLKQDENFAAFYRGIFCSIGTPFIFIIFYEIVFKVKDKRKEEAEVAIRKYLSTTDYKQVIFLYEPCDITKMLVQILQKEDCKFYAKLTENNNIHLIVKDKNNEEVYSTEIDNIFYFNANFTFYG